MWSAEDVRDQRMLHRLVDGLPGMVAYWSTDLRLVLANAAYQRFVGRPFEDLRDQPFASVLGADVYRANVPYLRAALAGTRQVFGRTLADGSGTLRHTEVSYSPDSVDGRVVGILALITDVTDRVETQNDLDEAQAIGGLASWTYRPADDTLTWSRHLHRLIEQDPDSDAADWATYTALVHPEDRAILESARDAAQDGRAHEARYRLLVDGEVRYVRSRGRALHNARGDLVLMRGTIQDETDLRLQANAADAANQRLADLIAMIGHDVRQPMTVILMHLEEALALWHSLPPEQRKSNLAKAFAAAERMNQMLDDILTMINPDSGALAVHPTRAGLGDLVADALASEHYPVVPHLDVRHQAVVAVDPFHLRQILGNLLSNAARHAAPPVTIVIEASEHEVHMRVTDTGPGVPDAFVPHLFDRFTRADSAHSMKSSTPGSRDSSAGFGLYLVHELVHANGGTIAYRRGATGAEFHLTFPTTRDAPHSS